MKRGKISAVLIVVFLLSISNVVAEKINSTTYQQRVIVSAGGEDINSTTYKNYLAAGIINRIINSTSYINKLGFFHLFLLADNQPCTSASQCEGGFCCSNKCKSSSCPVAEEAAGGGGGGAAVAGGGGGGLAPEELPIEKVKDFSISSTVKEHLALGEEKTRKIRIKNTGNAELSFDLKVLTIEGFVSLSESSFSLAPEEEKTIELNILGRRLGSYIGEIEVVADGIKKSITVIVEVESGQVIFDVKMDIPLAYKEVEPGSQLRAQITLLNVGPAAKKVDVIATYLIKDKRGNVVEESSETFAVEKQLSFAKSFKIPKNLAYDEYLAVVEARYENSFAVSSELFRVVPSASAITNIVKSGPSLAFIFAILIGFVILFGYLLVPKDIFKKSKQKDKSKKG